MFRKLANLHQAIWLASRMAVIFPGVPSWMSYVIYVLIIITLVSLGVGVILLFVWPFIMVAFWQRIRDATMASLWLRGIATAILLVVGIIFYILRRYMRSTYGSAEIIIGITGCWAGLGNQSSSTLSASLSVGTGIYAIVRGIDNIMEARAKRKAAEQGAVK